MIGIFSLNSSKVIRELKSEIKSNEGELKRLRTERKQYDRWKEELVREHKEEMAEARREAESYNRMLDQQTIDAKRDLRAFQDSFDKNLKMQVATAVAEEAAKGVDAQQKAIDLVMKAHDEFRRDWRSDNKHIIESLNEFMKTSVKTQPIDMTVNCPTQTVSGKGKN